MRNRVLVLTALNVLSALLLLGCSLANRGLSRTTPTPTKTLRLLFTATLTPTASAQPSDTPAPTQTSVPTDTPVLPTVTPLPTETPLPPDTPIPPTDTPIPPADTVPPPTDAPRPEATKPPAPPTNTPRPQVDFQVKEVVAFVDGSLSKSGFHNIYFTVVDVNGNPLDNILLEDENGQAQFQPVTGTKGPGKAEFEMLYADYRFKVASDTTGRAYSSEVTHQLSLVPGHSHWPDLIAAGICPDEAACRALGSIHYSYKVTFQRTW